MDNRPAALHVEIALHVGKCGGIPIRPASRRDVAEAFRVFREVGNGDVVHRRAGLLRRSLLESAHRTRSKSSIRDLGQGAPKNRRKSRSRRGNEADRRRAEAALLRLRLWLRRDRVVAKRRRRRVAKAEVSCASKSASLRQRLPFLNAPWSTSWKSHQLARPLAFTGADERSVALSSRPA